MYSRIDILSNVKQINNILSESEFLELKNIITTSNIKIDNIFSTYSQYYIDLLDNKYVTQTILPIIKNKFNYNGVLETAIGKIQSFNDCEKFHTITEDENYTVFVLDINQDNRFRDVTMDNIVDIVEQKSGITPTQISRISPDKEYIHLHSSLYNDPLTITSDIADFYKSIETEKQNLFDLQGYLYFLPSDNSSLGIAYEHINNNCIKFPGNIIHKMKPYFNLSNTRRISIVFSCKNL
jgi:hypothetical protein